MTGVRICALRIAMAQMINIRGIAVGGNFTGLEVKGLGCKVI